jgi:hypothetical protein
VLDVEAMRALLAAGIAGVVDAMRSRPRRALATQ